MSLHFLLAWWLLGLEPRQQLNEKEKTTGVRRIADGGRLLAFFGRAAVESLSLKIHYQSISAAQSAIPYCRPFQSH
jgi:hypothetical protein